MGIIGEWKRTGKKKKKKGMWVETRIFDWIFIGEDWDLPWPTYTEQSLLLFYLKWKILQNWDIEGNAGDKDI